MAFPGTYNFSYYRGDTLQFVVRPKNADGTAFDLSGYDDDNTKFTIANRRGSTGTQYIAEATIDSEADIITCTITPVVGSTLVAGSYVYDVEISNTSQSIISTIVTGTITVTDHVSGAV